MADSSEALGVEEALQRQCQTFIIVSPHDYCASRFFWIFCSSDRRLWPGAESFSDKQTTNKLKWPSAVVLRWTESRFSGNTNTEKKSNDTSRGAHFARPSQSRRAGSLGGRPHSYAFLALSHSLREKLSLLLVVSAAWLPSRQKGGKKLFVLLGSKKCGHWVGVLSRHPWCWISKYVLEHPQSYDLACVVRSVNSSPSPILR